MLCITTTSRGPHHLHNSQDVANACGAAVESNRCMNGYYQSYVIVLLECGLREEAVGLAEHCQSSSSGTICGSVNTDILSQTVTTECGSSPTTCSSDCQGLLTAIRAKLGCCISYLNNTDNRDDVSAFNNSLWSLCDVELVTEKCTSGLNLPNTTVDPTHCPLDKFYEEVFCRTQYFESDRITIAENCKFDPFDLDDLCTVNEKGKYCHAYEPNAHGAFSNCADTSTCDPLCIESLSKITTCCFINEYNGTENTGKYDWLSYEFWSQCGLNSPGFCKTKLTNGPLLVLPSLKLQG